jgi:hypothetical protein
MSPLFAQTVHDAPGAPGRILASRYLCVYARIAEAWGTPALPSLLHGLIISDRANRRGFPPEVMRDLLDLVCHARCQPQYESAFEWFEILLTQIRQNRTRAKMLNTTNPDTMGAYLLFLSFKPDCVAAASLANGVHNALIGSIQPREL